ncbi:helix-turn-helix domain-containing protein [Pectobacterium atrosepticum]|nr:helix-turn-helix domain-containing protein [Pectobacterium atrosepticum]
MGHDIPEVDLSACHALPYPYSIEIYTAGEVTGCSSVQVLQTSYRFRCYMLVWVTQGESHQWLDFELIQATRGTLIVVKPEQVHSFGSETDWQGWVMLFHPEALPRDPLAELSIGQLPCINCYNDETVAVFTQALSQISQDYRNNSIPQLLQYQLYALLTRILSLRNTLTNVAANNTSTRLLAFDDLINHHFRQQHNVAFYAESLNCSEKSLNRASRQVDHRTAKQRIDERIVLEAKRLLIHSPESAVTIGIELGFSEATHFGKFFKRKTGQTPLEFRKTVFK